MLIGLGEGKKAHGFTLGICDSTMMMQKDGDGFPIFGKTHDDNLVFGGKNFNVCDLKDATDKRTVLNELHKDGCVLIDGQSGRFAASNYFVGDVSNFPTHLPFTRFCFFVFFLRYLSSSSSSSSSTSPRLFPPPSPTFPFPSSSSPPTLNSLFLCVPNYL